MEEQKEAGNLKKEVEAILFAAGRKVGLEEIAALCKENDISKIKSALSELKKDYDASDSPMFLIQEGDGWKMTVKEKYLGLVKDVAPHTELNKALLETLAIIAWKQPVFQSDVIKVRGSSAYEHIRDLVEMGFITKVKHGRSFILKPSTRFFDYFDLPSKEAMKEVFKEVESADSEKRKEMGEPSEEQQKIGEETEKVGRLEVFEAPEKKDENVEKAEQEMETEKLGGLEVFEEQEEKAEEKEEEAEEELPEEGSEEKTKRIVEEIMHEEKEEGDEDTGSEEPEDSEQEEAEEEKEKKGRVSKELERFAGLDEGEKEESEEAEDSGEESRNESED